MRFYQYSCRDGHTQEEYRATEDRNYPVKCKQCKRRMKLQIAAVPGIVKSPAVPRRFTKSPR